MIVLDASVVLAALNGEHGSGKVELLLSEQRCAMSAVNRSEVVAVLVANGMPARDAVGVLDSLNVQTLDFTRGDADLAGALRSLTADLGLGDRACLAAAIRRDAPVFTADRSWAQIDLPIDLHVVR